MGGGGGGGGGEGGLNKKRMGTYRGRGSKITKSERTYFIDDPLPDFFKDSEFNVQSLPYPVIFLAYGW